LFTEYNRSEIDGSYQVREPAVTIAPYRAMITPSDMTTEAQIVEQNV
jgi:hypothetical protein